MSKVSESDLSEAIPNEAIPRLVPNPAPRVFPSAYTHKLAQDGLISQIRRNALHVKPTIDDLRIAQDKFEGEQKRIDRAYDEALKDSEKWAEIRNRRLKSM